MLKVLLPLRDVPLLTTVTKRTGRKEYLVKGAIHIHGTTPQVIEAEEGVLFLVSKAGEINAVPDTTEVIADLADCEVMQILEEQHE